MAASPLPLHPELAPQPPPRRPRLDASRRVPVGYLAVGRGRRVLAANQEAAFLLHNRHLVGMTLRALTARYAVGAWGPLRHAQPPFSMCRRVRLRDGIHACVLHVTSEEGQWLVRFQPADELGLLEHLTQAAGLVDERGRIVSVNGQFCRQFGVEAERVVGESAVAVLQRFYPNPSLTTHLLDVVLSGEPWAETPQLLLGDGRRHILQVRLVPWRYGGCVCGLIWLASDATDVAEGAEQRTAAILYRIMATLQHELRNPLQTMQAAVDVLRAEVSERGQRYLNVLAEHIRLIDAELSDQMLFGAQAQTVFVPGRMSQVVAVEIERASLRARTAGLRFQHVPPENEPTVQLHPGSLGRVFANLFRNTAQARPDATVEISYRVESEALVCSVRDNGPGFPERAVNAAGTWLGAGAAPGTRLGLAIVASTVEAHGGTVSLGNHPGGGAQVMLRLPLATAAWAWRGLTTPAPDPGR